MQIDGSSLSGGRSNDGEQAANTSGGGYMDSSSGQAASLSSLDEIALGLAKRTRRKPTFDDHVSYIEANDQDNVSAASSSNSKVLSRRKWSSKDTEHDSESQKSIR